MEEYNKLIANLKQEELVLKNISTEINNIKKRKIELTEELEIKSKKNFKLKDQLFSYSSNVLTPNERLLCIHNVNPDDFISERYDNLDIECPLRNYGNTIYKHKETGVYYYETKNFINLKIELKKCACLNDFVKKFPNVNPSDLKKICVGRKLTYEESRDYSHEWFKCGDKIYECKDKRKAWSSWSLIDKKTNMSV